MQIIEHGNKAPIIICSCGCKFIYENSDICVVVDNGTERKTVMCPECDKIHTIEETAIE